MKGASRSIQRKVLPFPSPRVKFHISKLNTEPFVEVWGSGNVKREFLHVDDLASACLFLLENVI